MHAITLSAKFAFMQNEPIWTKIKIWCGVQLDYFLSSHPFFAVKNWSAPDRSFRSLKVIGKNDRLSQKADHAVEQLGRLTLCLNFIVECNLRRASYTSSKARTKLCLLLVLEGKRKFWKWFELHRKWNREQRMGVRGRRKFEMK